jgi:hypothetical protein
MPTSSFEFYEMDKLSAKVKARTDSHIRKFDVENYATQPKEGRLIPQKPNYSMVYEPNTEKITKFYNKTRYCGNEAIRGDAQPSFRSKEGRNERDSIYNINDGYNLQK